MDAEDHTPSEQNNERQSTMADENQVEQRLRQLESAGAATEATLAGAQATQAAANAGTMSTMAATNAGTMATMAAGSVGFIVGIFLGMAIANQRR